MTEANLFQQHAKEAMRSASKSPSKNEAWDLVDLACTWARARWRAKGYWVQASLRRRATLAKHRSPVLNPAASINSVAGFA